MDFTGEVVDRMRRNNITKAELAKRLKTSAAFVTKLLSGENNFTIETMVKVALALDAEVQIRLPAKGSSLASMTKKQTRKASAIGEFREPLKGKAPILQSA